MIKFPVVIPLTAYNHVDTKRHAWSRDRIDYYKLKPKYADMYSHSRFKAVVKGAKLDMVAGCATSLEVRLDDELMKRNRSKEK